MEGDNMNKIELLTDGLEKMLEETKLENKRLNAEDRFDEGLFQKIRMNVFEIFIKMVNVAKRADDFEKEFKGLLVKIPQNWYLSLEEAKTKDDFDTEKKELVKIEAKDEIEKLFGEIYG